MFPYLMIDQSCTQMELQEQHQGRYVRKQIQQIDIFPTFQLKFFSAVYWAIAYGKFKCAEYPVHVHHFHISSLIIKTVHSQVLASRSDFALASHLGKFWGEVTYPTHPVDIMIVERAPKQLRQYMNLLFTFDIFSWSGIFLCYLLTCAVMCIGCYYFQSEHSLKVM